MGLRSLDGSWGSSGVLTDCGGSWGIVVGVLGVMVDLEGHGGSWGSSGVLRDCGGSWGSWWVLRSPGVLVGLGGLEMF